jgi:hypothetical protein
MKKPNVQVQRNMRLSVTTLPADGQRQHLKHVGVLSVHDMCHLLVLCLSLARNTHHIKRVTDLICKGEKRLRYCMRHSKPPNHTNTDVVLKRIRK